MRIGIDARWILRESAGIGVSTRELIANLARLDTENEYVLFFRDPALLKETLVRAGLERHTLFQTRLVPFGVFSVRGQLALPRLLRNEQLDVFHSPNYMFPLLAAPRRRPGPLPCLVTLHDVIPLLFPEHSPRSKKRLFFPVYRFLMHEIARRADTIVTVSETSRRDIIRVLRIPAEREGNVVVVPDGVAACFCPAAPAAQAGAAPADRKRTILYVGRSDPYKNLVGLVEAFARARRACAVALSLRIIGPRDPRYPEPARRAAQLGVSEHVEWTGYLPEPDLVRAYREADLLALPSRYEGFGMPVLEAMACGTPVVCSNGGSLPEVAADAAVRVEADDIDGLANALVEVLTHPAKRDMLIQRGLARAAQFSWESAARRLLAVYQETAAAAAGHRNTQ
ncbi:MAG: glycosyltransferase family 4 protein [Kiritimatiellae bacterium]|nr:glycosyltransferase family 4 protein [Kiritimatiellia bacterium]